MKDSRTYSKEYKSETYQEDISYHGSPIWKDHQRECKEDKNLREEIIGKFGVHDKGNILFGFDGRFAYFFTIKGYPQELEDALKNVMYDTEVNLQILGNEKDLINPEKLSDLEKFLLEHNFKKIKSE